MNLPRSIVVVFAVVLATASWVCAETGAEGWLRYAPGGHETAARYEAIPNIVISLGNSEVLNSAKGELGRGIGSMLGKPLRAGQNVPAENALVLGTLKDVQKHFPEVKPRRPLQSDGFWLRTVQHGSKKYWLIIGGSDRGVLYGTFVLLSQVAQQQNVNDLDDVEVPSAPIRWASQWDNLDGSIERGYAGRSIFFEDGHVRTDLSRAAEYARLLASVGINACAINNVNADPRLLRPDYLPELVRVAAVLRQWGIQLAISVDLSSPVSVGGMSTFDPLAPKVIAWWKQ